MINAQFGIKGWDLIVEGKGVVEKQSLFKVEDETILVYPDQGQ